MWNREFFVSEPWYNRSFVIVYIWEMIQSRYFISWENRNILKESYEFMPKCEVPKWSEYKWKRIFKYLRIIKSIIVFIGKYRCGCNYCVCSVLCAMLSFTTHYYPYRSLICWLSSCFSHDFLRFCLSLIKYLIRVSFTRSWCVVGCDHPIRTWYDSYYRVPKYI